MHLRETAARALPTSIQRDHVRDGHRPPRHRRRALTVLRSVDGLDFGERHPYSLQSAQCLDKDKCIPIQSGFSILTRQYRFLSTTTVHVLVEWATLGTADPGVATYGLRCSYTPCELEAI